MRIGAKGNGETPAGEKNRVRSLKGEALRKLTVRTGKAIRLPEPFAVSDPLKEKSVVRCMRFSLQAESRLRRKPAFFVKSSEKRLVLVAVQ